MREGLKKAGAKLLEPIMKVEVITPEEYTGGIIGDLTSRRGQVSDCNRRKRAAGQHVRLHQHAALNELGPRPVHHAVLALRAGSKQHLGRDSGKIRIMPISRRNMLLASLAMSAVVAGCQAPSNTDKVPLLSVARISSVEVVASSLERQRLATNLARSDQQIVQDVERVLRSRLVGLGSGSSEIDLTVDLKAIKIAGVVDKLLAGRGNGSGFNASIGSSRNTATSEVGVIGFMKTSKDGNVFSDLDAEYSATLEDFAAKLRTLLVEEEM